MKPRLARVLAGLALTTAAATGTISLHTVSVSADTAWGAPATEDDTAWGTPGDTPDLPPGDGEGPVGVPLDTAWG